MFKTQEPKYDVNAAGQIVNRATGAAIPDNEPVMIFRAQDPLAAPWAIAPYWRQLVAQGLAQQADVVHERLEAFEQFALDHPASMKAAPDTASSDVIRSAGPSPFEVIERGSRYRLTGGAVVQFTRRQQLNDKLAAVIPGTTTEELLAVLIDRVSAQDAVLPCTENKDILLHLGAALGRQRDRMAARACQGVEGTDKPHHIPQAAPGVVEQFGIYMHPVASSNLEAYGYRESDNTLALRFRGGRIYHYRDFPASKYEDMTKATSKGGYVAQHVNGRFEGVAMGVAPAEPLDKPYPQGLGANPNSDPRPVAA